MKLQDRLATTPAVLFLLHLVLKYLNEFMLLNYYIIVDLFVDLFWFTVINTYILFIISD